MSCADEATCIDNNTSLIKIHFVDTAGTDKPIILNRLIAIGNEDGFPQYDNDTTSSLFIAMNPELNYTTLIFEMPTGKDTLALSYQVTPTFVSSFCGIDFSFAALDTISTTFDELEIVDTNFNIPTSTNIEIVH